MSPTPAAAATADASPGWGARLAAWGEGLLAWLEADRRRAVLLAGLLACLLVSGAGGLAWWLALPGETTETETPADLATALKELDAERFEQAKQLALELPAIDRLPPSEWGGKAYVLGVATAREAAARSDGRDRNTLFAVAARYLEEARHLGFPHGRAADGHYWLGRALFETGQFPHSIPVLRQAWRDNPTRRPELHVLLATALTRDSNPRLAEALREVDQYLTDKMLSPSARADGLAQRAEILLRQGNLDAASQTLDELTALPEREALRLVLTGRLKLALADQVPGDSRRSLLQQAVLALRAALAADGPGAPSARPAHYLLGLAYARQDDTRAAQAQFARTRKLFAHEPEELAALWAEAELLRADEQEDKAAELYLAALAAAGPPESFSNPWLTLDELQAQSLAVYRHYLQAERYPQAVELAAALTPLHPAWRSLLLVAETHAAWAVALARQSERDRGPEALARAQQARSEFRAAGQAYRRLAEMRMPTPEYPDDIWNAAENLFRGRDYRGAARAYREMLQQEPRRRAPLALIGLAEAHEAEGQATAALAELRRCLSEFAEHPACFRARVVGARILAQSGQWEEARKWLRANLEHAQLTPRSLEWRDSLFALGQLDHDEAAAAAAGGRLKRAESDSAAVQEEADRALELAHRLYGEAARRLAEAVERFPEAPQRAAAQYLLADAYRQCAVWPERQLAAATIEATRVALRDEVRECLRRALTEFTALRQYLAERERATPIEAALLRNCYFAIGDAWFDLGDYKQAIDAYSTATNLYQSEPAALEAYVQIATCYRHLRRPIDARAMLEQASFVLQNTIPADAPFERTTRHSRQEWVQLLDWMRTL